LLLTGTVRVSTWRSRRPAVPNTAGLVFCLNDLRQSRVHPAWLQDPGAAARLGWTTRLRPQTPHLAPPPGPSSRWRAWWLGRTSWPKA